MQTRRIVDYRAREASDGAWEVVMFRWSGPDDDEPTETILERELDEQEAADVVDACFERDREAAYEREQEDFDRGGGHY